MIDNGQGRRRLSLLAGSAVAVTLAALAGCAKPPPPPPPPPPAVTASISKLKTGKAKLSRLRKGKWTASVNCSAKCSVRFTLKKGKTKIAKGTASRASAGKATAKLKLTKKGKKKLRGKTSIKLKLVAQRTDGGPKLTKTVRFK
jgi:hypothetical protein